MTLLTPWSPIEPAVGAVRPRLWCSVGMGSSLEAGAAAGSSTNRSPRGGPFSRRRELGAGPAAQQPVGRTRSQSHCLLSVSKESSVLTEDAFRTLCARREGPALDFKQRFYSNSDEGNAELAIMDDTKSPFSKIFI